MRVLSVEDCEVDRGKAAVGEPLSAARGAMMAAVLLSCIAAGCGASDDGSGYTIDGREIEPGSAEPQAAGGIAPASEATLAEQFPGMDGEPVSLEDQESIRQLLATQGFDLSEVRFLDNGLVVVEGDILFEARTLLESGLVEKGYAKTPGFVDKDVWLFVDPTSPISSSWQLALTLAAADLETKTEVNFHSDGQKPTDKTVTIGALDMTLLSQDFKKTVAFAGFPTKISGFLARVGSPLIVNLGLDDPSSPCGSNANNVTFSMKRRAMAHELSHTLGLDHPGESGSTLIPGTATKADNEPSLMWQGCPSSKGTIVASSDDVDSINFLIID